MSSKQNTNQSKNTKPTGKARTRKTRNVPLQTKFPTPVKPKGLIRRSQDKYVRQMLDPDSSQYAIMLPDRNSRPRCVRKFKKTFEIDSEQSGCENGFRAIVVPRLNSPVLYNGPDSVIPSIAGALQITGQARVYSTSYVSHSLYRAEAGTQIGAGSLEEVVKTTSAWVLKIDHTVGAAASCRVTVSTNSRQGIALKIVRAATADAAWTDVATEGALDRGTTSVTNLGALAFNYLGFVFTHVANAEIPTFHFSYVDSGNGGSTSQAVFQSVRDMCRGELLHDLGEEAQGGRLVGLSMLASNTSSELGRNGVVFAARPPSSVSPFLSSGEMQGRCSWVHSGQAKDGAYVWWMPSEVATQSYLDMAEALQELANDDYLWMQVSGWGGDQKSSMLITVVACVEFFGQSQLFEKIPPPIRTPEWDRAVTMMASLPSATCNPDHKELFRALVGKAQGTFQKAADHYNENKTLYDSLFRMLMGF